MYKYKYNWWTKFCFENEIMFSDHFYIFNQDFLKKKKM